MLPSAFSVTAAGTGDIEDKSMKFLFVIVVLNVVFLPATLKTSEAK